MAGHVSDSAPRKMIPCTTENTRQYKAKGLGNVGKYAHHESVRSYAQRPPGGLFIGAGRMYPLMNNPYEGYPKIELSVRAVGAREGIDITVVVSGMVEPGRNGISASASPEDILSQTTC